MRPLLDDQLVQLTLYLDFLYFNSNDRSSSFKVMISTTPGLSPTENPMVVVVVVQGSIQTPLVYETLEIGIRSRGCPVHLRSFPSCNITDSPDFPSLTITDHAVAVQREVTCLVDGGGNGRCNDAFVLPVSPIPLNSSYLNLFSFSRPLKDSDIQESSHFLPHIPRVRIFPIFPEIRIPNYCNIRSIQAVEEGQREEGGSFLPIRSFVARRPRLHVEFACMSSSLAKRG